MIRGCVEYNSVKHDETKEVVGLAAGANLKKDQPAVTSTVAQYILSGMLTAHAIRLVSLLVC